MGILFYQQDYFKFGYGFNGFFNVKYPFLHSETFFHFGPIRDDQRESASSYYTDFLASPPSSMPSTSDLQAEYRFIFDIILIFLLFVLLLLTLALIFFKQKNVPVSQCIEVDPREPHSITITFVPANINSTAITTVDSHPSADDDTTQPAGSSTQAPDRPLSTNGSQTAPMA